MADVQTNLSNLDNYIRTELPQRSVTIKGLIGDPTLHVNARVINAPIGTFYLDSSDNNQRWERFGNSPSQWRKITTSDSGGLSARDVRKTIIGMKMLGMDDLLV